MIKQMQNEYRILEEEISLLYRKMEEIDYDMKMTMDYNESVRLEEEYMRLHYESEEIRERMDELFEAIYKYGEEE